MSFIIPDVLSPGGAVCFQWRNADTGTIINPVALVNNSGVNPTYVGAASTIITVGSSTRFEVCLSLNGPAGNIGETGTGVGSQTVKSFPSATIIKIA
jgi:hypothetical protein